MVGRKPAVGQQLKFPSIVGLQRRYLHPADILNNLNVVEGGLLQLQELCGLLLKLLEFVLAQNITFDTYHQVLKLQSALRHVMALAPLLNTSDVIVDL